MTTQAQDEILLGQIQARRKAADRRTFRMLQPVQGSIEKPWERIDLDELDRREEEDDRRKREMDSCARENALASMWNASGVGLRFARSRLDNYETPTESHAAALAACREAVDGLADGDGVVLLGEPEGGKTHLLCGMLWEAARRGMSIRYTTAEDFYIGLRSAISQKEPEGRYIEELAGPAVLAIDDLYCVAPAKSAHEESYQYRMLWALLDRRYRNCRATVSSTNKPLTEFRDMLDERTRRRLEAKIVKVPKRVR